MHRGRAPRAGPGPLTRAGADGRELLYTNQGRLLTHPPLMFSPAGLARGVVP